MRRAVRHDVSLSATLVLLDYLPVSAADTTHVSTLLYRAIDSALAAYDEQLSRFEPGTAEGSQCSRCAQSVQREVGP